MKQNIIGENMGEVISERLAFYCKNLICFFLTEKNTTIYKVKIQMVEKGEIFAK